MGLLSKLFGGDDKEQSSAASTVAVKCPHAVLVPRWDSVEDMGHEDRATRFMCESCHEEFTPEVAAELRGSINARMDATLAEFRENSEADEEKSA